MQRSRAKKFSKCIGGGLVGLACVLSASAAVDFPQWRGPARDGAISGPVPSAWPEKLKQVWRIKVGEGHASPLIVGSKVFQFARLGEREILSAHDLATGKTLWEYGYNAPYEMNGAAAGHGKGPKSTPVAAQGKVCAFGISGAVSCVDEASGKLVWKLDPQGSPTFGVAMSPAVVGDKLVVHTGTEKSGALTAYNIASGKPVWSWNGDTPAYASPVIGTFGGVQQLITQTHGHIVGLDAGSGQLLWKIPLTTPYDQNSVTPLVVGDMVLYSGLQHPFVAVRPAKRGNSWAADKVWENMETSMYMSSPVISGGLVWGLTNRNKGQFFALGPKTGKTVWTGQGRQAENAALLASGVTLFALTTNSELLVMRTSNKGATTLRTYTVADSPTWAHPAIAGGKILTKDKESLTLWSAE